MRGLRLLVLAPCALLALPPAAALADLPGLCDLLGDVRVGEQRPVTVEGVFDTTGGQRLFYDPESPLCAMDVAPTTWLDFAESFQASESLDNELAMFGRVWMRVSGTLWGPGTAGEDDLSRPATEAWESRVAGRRYGPEGESRTRLVVERLEAVHPVADDLPPYSAWRRERPGSSVPVLLAAGLPGYPAAAARAGIEDVVTVRVTVAKGSVGGATVVSGDRILATAALEAIATWRFAPGTRAEFTSTFVFELHDAGAAADRNLQLDLRLPSYAGISAPRDGW